MSYKIFIGAGVGAFLTAASVALAAGGADQGTMMHDDAMTHAQSASSVMMMHPPRPMVLEVSANGNGLLRGVVASVGADSLTVAAWGGVWTVKTTSATNVVSGDLSNIAVGDFVGVIGSVSEDGPIITANVVRDWTSKHDTMMKKDDHMMASSSDSMTH